MTQEKLIKFLFIRKRMLFLSLFITGCFICGAGCRCGQRELNLRSEQVIGPSTFIGTEGRFIALYGVESLSLPASSGYTAKGHDFLQSKIEGKLLKVVVCKEEIINETTFLKSLVYLPSGELLNELVLAEGYCYVEKDELEDHPDLLERFLKIEKEAKAKKKGGWAYWAKKEAEKKRGN